MLKKQVAVELMKHLVNHNWHGYSQYSRTGTAVLRLFPHTKRPESPAAVQRIPGICGRVCALRGISAGIQ